MHSAKYVAFYSQGNLDTIDSMVHMLDVPFLFRSQQMLNESLYFSKIYTRMSLFECWLQSRGIHKTARMFPYEFIFVLYLNPFQLFIAVAFKSCKRRDHVTGYLPDTYG